MYRRWKTFRVLRPGRWLVLAAAIAVASAADQAAAPARIDIARSALLVIDATQPDGSLDLRIRRAGDHSAVDSKDITVAIEGKNQTVTRTADGSYSVPLQDLNAKNDSALEIVVGHDGIREILSAKLPPPAAHSPASVLGDHKQLAWWILNVAVLLVGAYALSRKKLF